MWRILLLLGICAAQNLTGQVRPKSEAAPWPTEALPVKAIAVPVFHTRDEGSSAMLLAISESKPCVVTMGESLDARFFKQGTFTKILDLFFSEDGIDPHEFYDAMLSRASKRDEIARHERSLQAAYKCCAAGYKTLIVAKHWGRAMPHKMGNLRHFFTMRGDLLRFSLATYRDANLKVPDHPQFDRSFVAPKATYQVAKLDKEIRKCINRWEEHTKYMGKLIRRNVQCDNIKILQYEDFTKNSTLFVQNWYTSAFEKVSQGKVPDPDNRLFYVYKDKPHKPLNKVHSDDIREFVKNSEDVLKHFDGGSHPSLWGFLQKSTKHLECSVKDASSYWNISTTSTAQ